MTAGTNIMVEIGDQNYMYSNIQTVMAVDTTNLLNPYNNLLLAECEVHTMSYNGPSFFLPFMAQVQSARAMKTGKEKKTRIHNLPYGLSK